MLAVRKHDGFVCAVYADTDDQSVADGLVADGCADITAEADYRRNSVLYNLVIERLK